MKATETSLLKFLQAPKQFTIPIYQRTYSWTEKQCRQLWEDIIRVAKSDNIPSHFIGSIVYIEKGIYQVASVPKLLVIDGQQRLTTISLLLAALGKKLDSAESQPDVTRKQINNYYLFNSEEAGDLRYKLMLTQSDKDTFFRLIEDKELPAPVSRRLVENYRFFETKLREDGIDPKLLYKGIAKLIVVDVSLDRNYDNPQLIFESLNSTGLDLTQADLIRNYVLMGLETEVQNELYTTHWFPMEQSFGHAQYAEQFDRFMRDYLTLKSDSGAIPKIEEVYNNFKKYSRTKSDIKELVADVWRHSKIWTIPEVAPEIISKSTKKKDEQTYTLDHFKGYLQGEVGSLFNTLRERILNLDSSVKEEVKKMYIAYKTTTNFVDIVPQKKQLRLSLNMPFDDIDDPKGICRDVSEVGRWGNGDVEVALSSQEQIDYVVSLIKQSFDRHQEDSNGEQI